MRINEKSLKYNEILQLSYFNLLSRCCSSRGLDSRSFSKSGGLNSRSFSVSEGLSSDFGAIAVGSSRGGGRASICYSL